jgi:hypothetical protein
MKRRIISWDCAHKSLAWSYFDIDTGIDKGLLVAADKLARMIKSYGGVSAMIDEMMGADALRTPTTSGSISCIQTTPGRSMVATDSIVTSSTCMESLTAVICEARAVIAQFLTFISAGVVDLLPGKKIADTTEVERTRALCSFLNTHGDLNVIRVTERAIADNIPVTVFIEHQPDKMGAPGRSCINAKSTMVSSQLMFYYIHHDPILVSPKLKDKLALKPGLELIYPKNASPSTKYSARKKHSCVNCRYLLNTLELSHIADDIPNAVFDDFSDSLLQAIAYLKFNRGK